MKLPLLPNFRSLRDRERNPLRDSVAGNGVKLERLCRPCRRERRGVAAVEFALVAPLFFLLVIGMIEFGRAVMVQQIITNASREGARIAVLDGTTGSEVQNTVENYLTGVAVSGATVTVQPAEPSTAGYGEPVTVTVEIPFSAVSWVPLPNIPFSDVDLKSRKLVATTVMRRETVQ
ncbi:MAG: TadE/TadG family type IV pilus assembly protein [Planctomycetota bacterium]